MTPSVKAFKNVAYRLPPQNIYIYVACMLMWFLCFGFIYINIIINTNFWHFRINSLSHAMPIKYSFPEADMAYAKLFYCFLHIWPFYIRKLIHFFIYLTLTNIIKSNKRYRNISMHLHLFKSCHDFYFFI